jgi:HEAT repeat protein
MNKRKHVFLSYRSIEVDFALKLAADLKNAGVNLWMDRLDIKPGDDWLKAIQQAVNDCAAMIPVLSQHYIASKYCQRELARADRMGRPIFPVILQPLSESDWPFEIERQQYIDFVHWREESHYAEQLPKLVDILKATVSDQISVAPDPETRYINTLIAELEARKGVIGYFESTPPFDTQAQDEAAASRPRPIFAETWNLNGRYALLQDPKADRQAANTPALLNGISEALEKYPRFVLVGESGSGKTITLNHLVLEAARRYLAAPRVAPLPLLLRLHEWDDETSLPDFVHANWPLDSDPIKLLAKGKAALYVDGLNEVDESAGIRKIAFLRDWLKAKNAPQRAVFTCRMSSYELGASLGIPTIQTVDLETPHIQRFVEHYLDGDEASFLLSRIMPVAGQDDRSSRYLFRMARSPFLLSALILIFKNSPNHDILYSVGEVSKRLVANLWERKQHLTESVTFESLEAVLAELAFVMVDADLPVFIPLDDGMEYLTSRAHLDAAITTNLLELEGNQIRFSHELIKEYFAAVGLMRTGLPTRLTRPQIDDNMRRVPRKWDSIMSILAGIAQHPDSVILNILEVDPYLALQCSISGVNCSEQTYQTVVNRLLDMMQVEGDGRVAVARILIGSDDEKSLLLLLEAMRDGAWMVRMAGASALREMNIPPMPGLTEAIQNLDDSTRESTLYALRQMSKKAIPTLLGLLRDPNYHTRRGAAWALGELKDGAAVPMLLDTLEDPDYLVGADAALALGRIKDPAAVPGLLHALGHENWRVSKAASKALAWIGAPAAPGLIEILNDPASTPRKQVRTIDALAHIKDENVATTLLKASRNRNVEVRSAAIDAMRNYRDSGTIKRLIECLSDSARSRWSKQRICDVAASILVTIGTDEALAAVKKWRKSEIRGQSGSGGSVPQGSGKKGKERLARLIDDSPEPVRADSSEALHDPDWMVRREAVVALGSTPAAYAVPRLIVATQDEDNQVRMSVMNTLANFKDDPQVIPTLLQALGDDDYLVCDAAKEALKRDGKPPIPGLLDALHSSNVNVRGAAIEVLGAIGEADAIPDIIDALADIRCPWLYEQRICDIAARALEAIGTPETQEVVEQWRATHHTSGARVSPSDPDVIVVAEPEPRDVLGELLAQLHESDWNIQQDAAKALRDYAQLLRGSTDSPFIERLVDALQDKLWVVRWAAAEALAWIRDYSTVPAITILLGDSNKTVRVAAVRALSEIKDVTAVPDVARALADKSTMVREAAAEALGNLGDARAVPALLVALEDGDSFVRLAAIDALGKIKHASAGEPLLKALHDSDPTTRCFAADALGRMGYTGAVTDLIGLLDDTYEPSWDKKRVCDIAAQALNLIGTPEAARALSEWRRSQPVKN